MEHWRRESAIRRYRILAFPGGRGTGEIIGVYPGATLRQMGLANCKSRPEEAIRLGMAACTAAGVTLDVDPRLRALCCRYSSAERPPTTTLPLRSSHFARRSSTPKGRAEWRLTTPP